MPYKNYQKALEYNRNWIRNYRAKKKAEEKKDVEERGQILSKDTREKEDFKQQFEV